MKTTLEHKYKKYIDLLPSIDQNRVLGGREDMVVVVKLLKKAVYWYYNAKHQEYYNKEFSLFNRKVGKKREEYDVIIKDIYNEINNI